MPSDHAPRLCAIVPAYQARPTLPALLDGIAGAVDAIVVVDDGSTDGTAEWLLEWSRAGADRIVIRRAANGGKAEALQDGFRSAMAQGFDLALTIDADGQHDPADAVRLARESRVIAERPILLCGVRDAATPGYPRRNLTGRRLNDLAIRAQTGVRVEDSPCGLRIYSLELLRRVRCMSGRFAWEEEFITRAIWAGARYHPRRIRCIYDAIGPRRSHYRFRRDWPEGMAINLWLCAIALVPPPPTRAGMSRIAWQIGAMVSPLRALDQVIGDSPSRLHGAAAASIGAAAFGGLASSDAGSTGSWIGGAAGSWVAGAAGAWVLLRLHGSLWVGIAGGAAAAAAARWPISPILSALALLLVLSIAALRRRAA